MLESFVTSNFEYTKLTEAEQKARRILGRLTGVIAETRKPTRNGRGYSIELWENVFANPIMQEKIANRCCFGELNHPTDRTEIDIEKVAICLAEQPKKGKDGRLYGVFDILDTPNGRILKTLCDYGCKIGISSRGQGDIITNARGEDEVDPETYECECFDAVLIPGVESARLSYVTESLDSRKGKTLRKALCESLEDQTEEAKAIMRETLTQLNLLPEDAENIDAEAITEPESALETSIENMEVEAESTAGTSDASEASETSETSDTEEAAEEEAEDQPEEQPEGYEQELESDLEDESEEDSDDESADPTEAEDVEDVEDASEEVEDEAEKAFIKYLNDNFDAKTVLAVIDLLKTETADDAEEDETQAEADVEDESSEPIDSEIIVDTKSTADEEPAVDIDNSDKELEEQTIETADEAVDDGAAALVNTLKEAIKDKADLESQVKTLQEKLAVSDAKVSDLETECGRYKSAIARMSSLAKAGKGLSAKISELEESLKEKCKTIEKQNERIARFVEGRKKAAQDAAAATTLTESMNAANRRHEAQVAQLTEQFNAERNKSEATIKELNENLAQTAAIKESYRKLATKAVNKYIDMKAETLGVTSKDIKRKLGETYTIEDVDRVCEDLKAYQLNVSRLPFNVDRKVSIRVNEGAGKKLPSQKTAMFEDDDVDDTLIRLANFD